MLITPKATNAITIELEDGSIFEMHHTSIGPKDRLYISSKKGIKVAIRESQSLDWIDAAEDTTIRLTVKD